MAAAAKPGVLEYTHVAQAAGLKEARAISVLVAWAAGALTSPANLQTRLAAPASITHMVPRRSSSQPQGASHPHALLSFCLCPLLAQAKLPVREAPEQQQQQQPSPAEPGPLAGMAAMGALDGASQGAMLPKDYR